ncbi:MAG TPA: WecB/TagA/CpsF family glycosyltransferase [Lacipirellulaceae bacterium]|nr:WecB/TagA/CpsF family glycosyltransferase [Lacipirellulaceae bacterium]
MTPQIEPAEQPTAAHAPGVPGRRTVRLFGMTVDALTMSETIDAVLGWCRAPRGESCRFVVTPNVDHAVMFQHNAALRAAYRDAALVLADGAPVVAASRLLRRALPERVPGSDLAPAMFKRVAADCAECAATAPLRVFLLGAGPGVADRAAANIGKRWPGVCVVGTLSPPLGFERDDAENARILAAVAGAKPDVLLVGFGAPKQELWVHAHARELDAKAALCIGATIDFLAGEKRRAPRWMRRIGLEWLHRLSTEPRRLAKRYLRDAWIFPRLLWREWRGC